MECVRYCIKSGNHHKLDPSIDNGKWFASKVYFFVSLRTSSLIHSLLLYLNVCLSRAGGLICQNLFLVIVQSAIVPRCRPFWENKRNIKAGQVIIQPPVLFSSFVS